MTGAAAAEAHPWYPLELAESGPADSDRPRGWEQRACARANILEPASHAAMAAC
jgi:hypothetical protein